MTPQQKQAHERLQKILSDRITTHYRPAVADRRRGLGFMADAKGWSKIARARQKSGKQLAELMKRRARAAARA